MFKVEILDAYNGRDYELPILEEVLKFDTLGDALNTVKETVMGGRAIEDISLWQEIPLDVTVSVTVKAE
jgi:hypothetical protein